MDLIYTDANRNDLGVLIAYELDLAFGEDENNFECTVSSNNHCCSPGSYLYMEGTEYGGIVDAIANDTAAQEITYSGRTWHGILGSKIIVPLRTGETSTEQVTVKATDSEGNSLIGRYLILSGDANACLQFLIDRLGLSSMFSAFTEAPGVTITQFQFDRYTNAYTGISKMLASAGLKLKLAYSGGLVHLAAAAIYDYAQDEEFDTGSVDLDVKKSYRTVNHLICLGTGELEQRTVLHLYTDEEGNISTTQSQFGVNEYTELFDYANVESEEELLSAGTERLRELWQRDSIAIDFDESMDAYDIGDILGAYDNITGIRVSAYITKKIVSIKNGQIFIDLSTDTLQTDGQNASGDGTPSSGGSSGGGGSTSSITAGYGIKITDDGVISVDAAQAVEQDNTKPVTSAAVYSEVGNINALLETI